MAKNNISGAKKDFVDYEGRDMTAIMKHYIIKADNNPIIFWREYERQEDDSALCTTKEKKYKFSGKRLVAVPAREMMRSYYFHQSAQDVIDFFIPLKKAIPDFGWAHWIMEVDERFTLNEAFRAIEALYNAGVNLYAEIQWLKFDDERGKKYMLITENADAVRYLRSKANMKKMRGVQIR